MKKTYIQPVAECMVYDTEIMQLPIKNSTGSGTQLTNSFYEEEEDEEEEEPVTKKRKSVWD